MNERENCNAGRDEITEERAQQPSAASGEMQFLDE